MIGKLLYRLIAKEDQDFFYFHLMTVFRNQATTTCELKLKRNDGTEFYAELQSHALKGINGACDSFRTIVSDITQRKESEILQLKLQQNLESLWELSRIQNNNLKFLDDHVLEEIKKISESRYAFYGFINHEETEMEIYSWSNEAMNQCKIDDKPKFFPIAKAGIWGRAVRQREKVIINDYGQDHEGKLGLPEGHVRLTRFVAIPVFNKGKIVAVGAVANKESDYTEDDVKQLEAFLSHAQIIAEQKRAQKVLKESEERFRFFVETANEGVWSMDGQFRTTFVNRKMAEMLGFSPEEMLGRTVDSFMFEEDSLDHEARMAKRQLGRNDSYERRFRRKDGEEVWTVVSATAMVDENREFQGSFAMFTDITERKLSEDKLRKSEERYRNLFENMIEGFAFRKMLYDDYGRPADYVFLNVNTAFEHITGLTNVVGQRATDVLPGIKDAHPELFEIYGEVAMTGRAKRFEFYMEPLKSWFDVSAHSPERDYFVTVVENITERKHMEEALRDSEATLRTVLQAAPIGIGLVTNRIFGWTNERLSQMTGYSAYDLLGRNAGILYESDEEFNRVGTAKYEQIKVRGIGEVETRWKHKDGALIDILLSSSSIVPGDLSKGVVFSATDITQRKKTEQALRDSEQRHRIVADFTYDWEYWVDAEGNFLYVSPSCERISGYSAEEFISDPDLMNRITHPDDRAKMLDHYHKERKVISPAVDTMDFRIIRRDGAIRWIAHVSQPVYGQEGQAFGRRGSNRDITDRKLAELSLKESGEFLNTILNAVPVPLFYKDTDCRYIGFNKSYEEFYGKTQQELVGKSVFDIAPRDLAEIYHAKDLELFDNPGAQVYDSQVKDARGAVHDVVFHKSTFLDLQGHVRGLIGVILDITERKQAENALWLSESQSNAILNGITANIGFLNDKLEILWVNKAAAASVGRLPDQMIGATCHSLWADPVSVRVKTVQR